MESTSMPQPRRSASPGVPDARFFERPWCLRAGLCAIALLAYANSFDTAPALDVRAVLEQDTRIRQASTENLGLILTKDYWWPASRDRLYRPVTTATFLFNYAILGNGDNLAGYHWINFLLHAGNVCLVFALAGRMFQRAGPAFFAAALWAVHPLGVESVTNIVGRSDLMAAMAVLGGLLLYIRTATLSGWRLLAAATGLLAIAGAGMFAKESAAVLPGVMLLWDLSFGSGQARDRWQRLLPYGAVMAAASLLWWVRERIFSALPWPAVSFLDNPIASAGFWTGRFTAVKVIGMDLWLLVCPWQLSADRSYNQIPLSSAGDAAAWLSLMAVVAILAVALWRRRTDRLIFWAAGFLGLTLLPTSNLIFPIGSIMAERFLYVPSIAFAIAAAGLAYRVSNRKLGTGILAAAVAIFAGRTLARNRDWQDNLALFTHDAGSAPASYKVHDTLGRSLFEQDPRANLDRAIGEAEIACAMLRPLPPALRSDVALNYLGMYQGVKADGLKGPSTAEGRRWYERALAALLEAREVAEAKEAAYVRTQLQHHKPITERIGFQDLYLNLGAALSRLGRREEALEAYRHGRNLNPLALEFYDGMAGVHVGAGNVQAAAVAMDEKAQLDGMQSATVAALQQFYAAIPGGGCAVARQNGSATLDAACPKLREDMCAAAVDLAQAFVEARRPDRARGIRDAAMAHYGCPGGIFGGAR
jgi:tetratricopeptide (TPR) repeat protein